MAQWSHYSTPNEEFVQALAQASPMFVSEAKEGEPEIIRRQRMSAEMSRKRAEAGGAPVGITVEERRVPVSKPAGEILVRVYTPESQNASEAFPVFVHMHGGGYCLGTLDTDELYCRTICATHRIVVVNVDYRVAPQFPWPTGPQDSYDAVKWVAFNAPDLRADLKKGFIVGGLSAGANFTCVIAQLAREDTELQGKITGHVLQIPSTLTHAAGYPEKYKGKLLSYEQNKDDPILSRENLSLFMDAYKPGKQSDPMVSPLLAESLAGLPPAYVQVAGADPLRDEGLLYTQEMEESGVPTKLDVYPGVPHGFANIYPQLTISAKWRADLDAGIRWLLTLPKS